MLVKYYDNERLSDISVRYEHPIKTVHLANTLNFIRTSKLYVFRQIILYEYRCALLPVYKYIIQVDLESLFVWIRGNHISHKVYFVGLNKRVKL